MATARKVKLDAYSVKMELSQREAEVLQFVLNRVGGSPEGPRGIVTGILRALEACGVEEAETCRTDGIAGSRDAIFLYEKGVPTA